MSQPSPDSAQSTPRPQQPSAETKNLAARARLEPIHQVLRAHRAVWIKNNKVSTVATRPDWWMYLLGAVLLLLVMIALITTSQILLWVALPAFALVVIGLAWRALASARTADVEMREGHDDLEPSEYISACISALRADLHDFDKLDLHDVMCGRTLRLTRKTTFLSSISPALWLPIWAAVGAAVAPLIPFVVELVRTPSGASLVFPWLQSLGIVVLGGLVGALAAMAFLSSATRSSSVWFEWELSALRSLGEQE